MKKWKKTKWTSDNYENWLTWRTPMLINYLMFFSECWPGNYLILLWNFQFFEKICGVWEDTKMHFAPLTMSQLVCRSLIIKCKHTYHRGRKWTTKLAIRRHYERKQVLFGKRYLTRIAAFAYSFFFIRSERLALRTTITTISLTVMLRHHETLRPCSGT